MELEVGAVVEGKVSGIVKFGAFVSLPNGKSGLVHISELARGYVNEVGDCVQVGQTVKVKVLSMSPDGKINLSIKQAADDYVPRAPKTGSDNARRSLKQMENAPPVRPGQHSEERARRAVRQPTVAGEPDNSNFEDRLKKFMQDSDKRIADNPVYSQYKQRNRRR